MLVLNFLHPHLHYERLLGSALLGDSSLGDGSSSLYRCTYDNFVDLNAALLNIYVALEVVQISSYYAQNCKANNEHIAALLATLVHALQPVITDLSSSVSSDAYTTFFRDIAYAPYVREVIYNITKGVPVPPEPGSSSLTPVFYCVDGRDQITYFENDKKVDTYTQCRTGNHAAMTLLKTPYIVICPVFFTQPAVPVRSTASCLTVDPHQNLFVGDGKSLYKYQLWHVLHELVHYYVYSTKGNALEVFPINICLFLFGEAAVLNAQSYIYYAASKRMIPLSLTLCFRTLLMHWCRYTVEVHKVSHCKNSAVCPRWQR